MILLNQRYDISLWASINYDNLEKKRGNTMNKIQIYLSMYKLLAANKQAQTQNELDEFLEIANPFHLDNKNNFSTLFINAYDHYFKDKAYDDKTAYAFILSFLNDLNDKKIVSIFKSIPIEQWLQFQQMITD